MSNSYQLYVKVVPSASRDAVCGWMGETLKVKLTAPPVDGRANESLVEFLAEQLGLPRRAIAIVRGETSRQKVLRIEGVTQDEVKRRLAQQHNRELPG